MDEPLSSLDRQLNLALLGWQNGTDVSKRQQLNLGIETAQINYERLEKRYQDSGGLNDQGFISETETQMQEQNIFSARSESRCGDRPLGLWMIAASSADSSTWSSLGFLPK